MDPQLVFNEQICDPVDLGGTEAITVGAGGGAVTLVGGIGGTGGSGGDGGAGQVVVITYF